MVGEFIPDVAELFVLTSTELKIRVTFVLFIAQRPTAYLQRVAPAQITV
jgi:hypothetical protein